MSFEGLSPVTLRLLDYGFVSFHTAYILFSLAGWAHGRTRTVHVWVMLATTLSWFLLGAIYGWGYCVLTDWHWQVRLALGDSDLPGSYVRFLLELLTRSRWDRRLVDILTVAGFGLGWAGALLAHRFSRK